MTEYQVQTTHVPPVLRLVDGVLHVEVIFGSQTFRAPIGDGRYFFSQLVEKLVDPALAAAHPRPVETVARMDYRAAPLISPND